MSNEHQSVKMWSGRFREPLDAQFEQWQRSIVFDWRLLPQELRDHATAEDIHHFVELALVARVGSLGLKLHTGRSRNEQIATDLRLFVRQHIAQTIEALASWAQALVEQASNAGDAVMPSYTHMQRAEPVLVAHWLLAYVEML